MRERETFRSNVVFYFAVLVLVLERSIWIHLPSLHMCPCVVTLLLHIVIKINDHKTKKDDSVIWNMSACLKWIWKLICHEIQSPHREKRFSSLEARCLDQRANLYPLCRISVEQKYKAHAWGIHVRSMCKAAFVRPKSQHVVCDRFC